ncbi:hypothetical protein ACFX11_038165 [Malus domestica]
MRGSWEGVLGGEKGAALWAARRDAGRGDRKEIEKNQEESCLWQLGKVRRSERRETRGQFENQRGKAGGLPLGSVGNRERRTD